MGKKQHEQRHGVRKRNVPLETSKELNSAGAEVLLGESNRR